MFKNKLLTIMLAVIIGITLVGVTALIFIMNFLNEETENHGPTIDEILEASVETEEITTNLLDDNFVRIKFSIQTDGKEAKEELEKRDFQVRNIIIQELSSMKSEQFRGKENLIKLENMLKLRINNIMQNGTVVRVYTTSFVLQ